jgi:hypothetical protein
MNIGDYQYKIKLECTSKRREDSFIWCCCIWLIDMDLVYIQSLLIERIG